LPGGILPLSKLPSSAVTVCVIASLFVHVTVVPDVTLREDGLKAIFFIDTLFGLFAGMVELLLLQAKNIIPIATTLNNKYMNLFCFFIVNDLENKSLLPAVQGNANTNEPGKTASEYG